MREYRSVFNRSPTYGDYGPSGDFPQRASALYLAEKSIIGAIFNKIAIDVSSGRFQHATVDQNGLLVDLPDSSLNRAFKRGPNVNQTVQDFIMDIVLTLCNIGTCAVVRVNDEEYQVGLIQQFYRDRVKVELFNNDTQRREDVVVFKRGECAVMVNPLYTVMNEGGSAIQRLMQKLGQLDVYSQAAMSGKINGAIAIPHDLGRETGIKQAKDYVKGIAEISEYSYNKYGFLVIGDQSKVTPFGRAIEPNVFDQVSALEKEVYAQLGIPQEVFLGTADEYQTRAYQSGTVEAFWRTISQALTMAFIDNIDEEKIIVTRDMFSGVTGQNLGDMVDRMSRNGIYMPNEIRAKLGDLASDDPIANSLANKNMPMQDQMYGQQYVDPNAVPQQQ